MATEWLCLILFIWVAVRVLWLMVDTILAVVERSDG